MGLKLMDQMGSLVGSFGDEGSSTLLDQYERLSFEVQLNQAILGRSLSEPAAFDRRMKRMPTTTITSSHLPHHPPAHPDNEVNVTQRNQGSGRPKSRFQRVLNRMFFFTTKMGTHSVSSTTPPTTKEKAKLRKKPFTRSLRA